MDDRDRRSSHTKTPPRPSSYYRAPFRSIINPSTARTSDGRSVVGVDPYEATGTSEDLVAIRPYRGDDLPGGYQEYKQESRRNSQLSNFDRLLSAKSRATTTAGRTTTAATTATRATSAKSTTSTTETVKGEEIDLRKVIGSLDELIQELRYRPEKGRQEGVITNMLASGVSTRMVEKVLNERQHQFYAIDADSGRILGAMDGNDVFDIAGRPNTLSPTGKLLLEKMLRGQYRRNVRCQVVAAPPSSSATSSRVPTLPHHPSSTTPTPPPFSHYGTVDQLVPKYLWVLPWVATDRRDSRPETGGSSIYPDSIGESTADALGTAGSFYALREECLRERRLYEDPDFAADENSLFYKTHRPTEHHKRPIVWKRPGEIASSPQFMVRGHSRFDVKQGTLSDCWFLAALADITAKDELFYRVVPPDQSFADNYAGIFHFYFWRYGQWEEVIVDDRLPTVDGKLYYAHSSESTEFWCALVEKAYAKLYGCYQNLNGGQTTDALEDLTGGLTEIYDIRKTDKTRLLTVLARGFQLGSLFGCTIPGDYQENEELPNGLVVGHTHSVNALHTVRSRQTNNQVVLLRVRNPWGSAKEWNGAWSDQSKEWDDVSQEEKEEMELNFDKDGEFWMSFDDFVNQFEMLAVCNLTAEVMNEISEMIGVESTSPAWSEAALHGSWNTREGTAGGCTNFKDSYWRNPQFHCHISPSGFLPESDGLITVIVAVMQKNRRERKEEGIQTLCIGFDVYMTANSDPLDYQFFRENKPVASMPTFQYQRQVVERFRLPAGDYVIIPSTFEPGNDGDFLVRIFVNGDVRYGRTQ